MPAAPADPRTPLDSSRCASARPQRPGRGGMPAGRGRGFKTPSPDRCLRLKLAAVFVVQLPTRSSAGSLTVSLRPEVSVPRSVNWRGTAGLLDVVRLQESFGLLQRRVGQASTIS